MATDSDYLKRLSDIDELKRYIRHLENRMVWGIPYPMTDPSQITFLRSAYLGERLSEELDRD